MDWLTFIASVTASLVGGGLISAMLTWQLDRRKLSQQTRRDAWQDLLESYEKQIDSAEKRSDESESRRLRLEYENQLAARRAQEELKGIVPPTITDESRLTISATTMARIEELIQLAGPLKVLQAADYYVRAIALHESGKFEDALVYLEKALNAQPEFFQAYTTKGVVLASLDRCEEALEAHSKAIELNNDFTLAYENRGIIFQRLGQQENALKDFDTVIQRQPKNAHALYHKGFTLENLEREVEALGSYRKCVELDPQQKRALERIVTLSERLNKIKDATEAYRTLVQMDPEDAHTHFHYGLALSKIGDNITALEEFDKATKLEPNWYEAHFNKAARLLGMQRYEDSLDEYKIARQLRPHDSDAYIAIAIVLEFLGRDDEATNTVDQLLINEPKNLLGEFWRGIMFAKKGLLEEAHRALDQAFQQWHTAPKSNDEGIATLIMLLTAEMGCRILASRGQNEAALDFIEIGLGIQPNDSSFLYNKACLLSRASQGKSAIESLRNAVRENPAFGEKALKDPDFEFIKTSQDFAGEFEQIVRT